MARDGADSAHRATADAPEPRDARAARGLEFDKRARRELEPTLRQFGMSETESGAEFVQWENDHVFLQARHAERDGEVALDIGRRERSERLSFLMFVRWREPDTDAARTDGVAWTSQEVDRVLGLYADVLARHAPILLRGDPATFDALARVHWWDVEPSSSPDKGEASSG